MSRPVPWTWLLPEDETRFAVLPPAGAAPTVHPGTVELQFTRIGAEQWPLLLLVGYAEAALDCFAADAALCQRTVIWAVQEGDLARLAAQAERLRTLLPRLLVAAWHDPGDLPRIVSRLPSLGWSLASLSDDAALLAQLDGARNWALSVGSSTASRSLTECLHYAARESRLGDALALTSWQGGWDGRTALCLAGGPGLDRDLAFIRGCMQRCVVVAADVVATRLAEAGIKIDFIVNADPHVDVAGRVAAPRDPVTVLVMPLTGHPELDRRLPRRSYEGADPLAGAVLGREHAYTHGTNVGSCTVGFAEYLGARELVLVGHDLSFAPAAYYSEFVAGRAQLEGSSLAHAEALGLRQVPGNGGDLVATSPAFAHGIDDLASFAAGFVRGGGRIYNRGCNHGSGAAIPFTEATPPGWSPLGQDAAPRPGPGRTLAELWAGRAPQPLAQRAAACLPAFRSACHALPAEPRAFLAAALALLSDPQHDLANALVAGFLRPALYQLACLVEREFQQAALAQALRQSALDLCDRGVALAATVLREGRLPSPAASADGPAAAVARILASQAPQLAAGSLEAVLIPLILRDRADAVALDPALPDLPLRGLVDGIHLLAGGAVADRARLLTRLLQLAAQLPGDDPLRYIAGVAQAQGVTLPPVEPRDRLPPEPDEPGPRQSLQQAERAAAAGRWQDCAALCAGIPLFHAAGMQAAILRCRCALHLQGEDAMIEAVNALPCPGQRVVALHGLFVAEEGPAQAIGRLAALGLVPVPAALLSESMRSLLPVAPVAERVDLAALHLALAKLSLDNQPPPAECAPLREVVALAERLIAVLRAQGAR